MNENSELDSMLPKAKSLEDRSVLSLENYDVSSKYSSLFIF